MSRRVAGWHGFGSHIFYPPRLSTKNHPEDKSDTKSRNDGFGWIFANVLFCVLLECAGSIGGIAPGRFCATARVTPRFLGFAAVLAGDRTSG
jgi:hypothetical protein